MSVIDLYSKRQKRLRGEVPDVYQYKNIPETLRVQIIHCLDDTLGDSDAFYSNRKVKSAYETLVDILRREYGVFRLPPTPDYIDNKYSEFRAFLLQSNTEQCIDAIELACRGVDRLTRDFSYFRSNDSSKRADDCLSEINSRFQENGAGFQWENGQIIRVDSQMVHAEVVKPALSLLSAPEYTGAQQEFLNAYEHYRHGRNKEALNDCLKSFESVMKAICCKRSWAYNETDTAKKLIEILFAQKIIPNFWQTQIASLRTLLESSVPTGRNKISGHGQGAAPKQVPDHIAAYMLHMTASTIVFLASSEASLS